MRTKIFNVLLALSVAVSAAFITAPISKAETYSGSFENGVQWYFDNSTGKLSITGYGKAGSYTEFPDEIDSYDIESVYIGDGITDVSLLGLRNFTNLSEITVSSYNDYYYSDSDGVLYTRDKTKLICFPQASELQSYDVLSGVETIGEYAFEDCNDLVCIRLPYSIRRIEGRAFGKSSYTAAPHGIEIPSTVDAIADTAFKYASNVNVYYTGSESQWDDIAIFPQYKYSTDPPYTLALDGVTVFYNEYMPVDDMIKAVNDDLNPPPENTSMTLGGLITIELLCSAVLFAIGYSIVKKYKESNAK